MTPLRANPLPDKPNTPAAVGYTKTAGELWRENRGSQLLGFAFIVFLVGSSILLYRQNRFVPPRFPNGDLIDTIDPEMLIFPSSPPDISVGIRVEGAASDVGQMRYAFYDSADTFNTQPDAVLLLSSDIANGEASILVPAEDLPQEFAVAVYHDENLDKSLDRSTFGIPTERYGFSNNARSLTGPPSYDSAKMERPGVGESIEISIR